MKSTPGCLNGDYLVSRRPNATVNAALIDGQGGHALTIRTIVQELACWGCAVIEVRGKHGTFDSASLLGNV